MKAFKKFIPSACASSPINCIHHHIPCVRLASVGSVPINAAVPTAGWFSTHFCVCVYSCITPHGVRSHQSSQDHSHSNSVQRTLAHYDHTSSIWSWLHHLWVQPRAPGAHFHQPSTDMSQVSTVDLGQDLVHFKYFYLLKIEGIL